MHEQDDSTGADAPSDGTLPGADHLFPLIYDRLRAVAGRYLEGRASETLQPTALVHEAFVSLSDRADAWQSQSHFAAVASKAMRDILIDHARRHGAQKRGGGWGRVTLRGLAHESSEHDVELIALHDALQRLTELDAEQARLVEMRFFAGMPVREIESVIGVPRSTVVRRLALAQAWLLREIDRGGAG